MHPADSDTVPPAGELTQPNGNPAFVAEALCKAPPPKSPPLPSTLSLDRAFAIVQDANKWANGTVLHYYFFDDPARDFTDVEQPDHSRIPETWVGDDAQRQVVRKAFQEWKSLGIGLDFVEVKHREEAEIRIGFMDNDGSWSYIGTEIVSKDLGVASKRTMNFGWNLLSAHGYSTALHEIGHTLGLPHEHQSPFSGITWDEPAVLKGFAGPPNNWRSEMIQHNILDKLSEQLVRGTTYDPESVMHYPFGPGLIKQPPGYYTTGLKPSGKLSPSDIAWVTQLYPPLPPAPVRGLKPFASQPLDLKNGEQADFQISPEETRDYDIRTFGKSDALLALFEVRDGVPRFYNAEDDSGQERNAMLEKVKLVRGRKYILRVRLKYRETTEPPSVMMW